MKWSKMHKMKCKKSDCKIFWFLYHFLIEISVPFSHQFIFLKRNTTYCREMTQVWAPVGGSSPWVGIQVLAILTQVSLSVGFPLDFVILSFSGIWSYILSQMKKIWRKVTSFGLGFGWQGYYMSHPVCLDSCKCMFVNWKYSLLKEDFFCSLMVVAMSKKPVRADYSYIQLHRIFQSRISKPHIP